MTGTVTVQEDDAARVPLRTVTVPPPTGASTVEPGQVVDATPATVTPPGRVSTRPGFASVLGTVLVLLILRVSVELPPTGIEAVP